MKISYIDLLANPEAQLLFARRYGVLPKSARRKRNVSRLSPQARAALKKAVKKEVKKYPIYAKTIIDIPSRGRRDVVSFDYCESFWRGTRQNVIATEQLRNVRAFENFCLQIEIAGNEGDFVRISVGEPTLAARRGDLGVGFRFSSSKVREFVMNWLNSRGLYVNSRGQIKVLPPEKLDEYGITNPYLLKELEKPRMFIFATKIEMLDNFGVKRSAKKRGRPRKREQ